MRIRFGFIAIAIILIGSACSNYTEELWINQDGTGSAQVTRDMGALLPLLQLGLMSDDDNTNKNPNNPMEQGKTLLKSVLERGKIDTTIVVADILQSALKKEGENFTMPMLKQKLDEDSHTDKSQKDAIWKMVQEVVTMRLRLQMDTENDLLRITTSQQFTDINHRLLSNLPGLLKLAGQLPIADSINANRLAAVESAAQSVPNYTFTDNKLSLRRQGLDLNTGDPQAAQGMEMAKGFMSDSKYTMIIHLPGKVKSVSVPGATYKKNSVTWEVPMTDLLDAKKHLDIDIDYKGKRKYRTIAPTW